jgi:hypothetical protein
MNYYEYRQVLDIAANDGTLLSYYPNTFKKYAIDPSNIVETIEDKMVTVIKDVFPTNKLQNNLKFDIITSIAVLYDLEDPLTFVNSIHNHLSDNGIWVFEQSYCPSMIKTNSFDTIVNEHVSYFTLSTIEYMLEQCGMKLIDVTLNDINGGSFKCVAVKNSCNEYTINNENINKLRRLEFDNEYDTVKPYIGFRNASRQIINKLENLITGLVYEQNKVVHLYGASTKGNTLLQVCGFDANLIPCAAERSPNKYGAHTLGTNIQIVSEEQSKDMKPDYYLVGPWHFQSEILEREKETIENGISFIFPLPNITIVSKDGVRNV